MRNADRKWSLKEKFLFVPSLLLLGSGVYLAVCRGGIDEQTGMVLGLVIFALGVYLWVQTFFHRDMRGTLRAKSRAAADFEGKSRILEAKAAGLQRQVELLAAQREVSRVASGEVDEKHSESILYEILRVVNNLIYVEDRTEVVEICVFLRDTDSGRLIPAAIKQQDTVSFGDDIDLKGLDLSLVKEAEEHQTTVSGIEKNTVEFALPLIADQEFMGVMYVQVVLQGERADLGETIGNLREFLQEMSQHISIPLMRHVLKSTSVTDGLTKLHNKTYFLDRLQEHFAMFKRGNFALSLLMIDIDHFKRINDEYGHLAGDAVLVQIADVVTEAIRSYDVAYAGFRYGGEELSVLLPRTDQKRALKVARRMRKDVADGEFLLDDGRRIKLTMSVGLAQASGKMKNREELIARADAALYRAKRTGRNRVCTWRGKESKWKDSA